MIRVKMGNKLGKLAGRETSEGTVQSYVHATGKVGVLVQVECNTDFVAKNEDFIEFAKDLALHIAALAADQVHHRVDDDPRGGQGRRAPRLRPAAGRHMPENSRARRSWRASCASGTRRSSCSQPHVNADKHDGKTIEQLRADLSAKTGENVVIRRFVRFAVGE